MATLQCNLRGIIEGNQSQMNEDTEEIAGDKLAGHAYLGDGRFAESEIVIGLVGAVGTDLGDIKRVLSSYLGKYKYIVNVVKISEDVITTLYEPKPWNDEFERINSLMDAGDDARETAQDGSILALGAATIIYSKRSTSPGGDYPKWKPKHAYVIDSLKHPDEVKALRHIYGDGFVLIGIYSDAGRRETYLTSEKEMKPDQARRLIARDESEEGKPFGQRTRDTFYLADFFLRLDSNSDRMKAGIERILGVLFGDPYKSPTFDEYAMFMAFTASLRSADLCRQVGAVIAKTEEVLAVGANDCPRFGGGLYWPVRHPNTHGIVDLTDGRDYTVGYDSNDKVKAEIVDKVSKALRRDLADTNDEQSIRAALWSSPIDDITEYGRSVHAEMDAMLTCARNGTSCRGATLYCTTFPCHNCAKHIIASGLTRVVYVEPYPKSRALDMHKDSTALCFDDTTDTSGKVVFEPFEGVGPRRFFDLFSMNHGTGYPLIRKDKVTGQILDWKPASGIIRMPMLPWSYLQREALAAFRFREKRREECEKDGK